MCAPKVDRAGILGCKNLSYETPPFTSTTETRHSTKIRKYIRIFFLSHYAIFLKGISFIIQKTNIMSICGRTLLKLQCSL